MLCRHGERDTEIRAACDSVAGRRKSTAGFVAYRLNAATVEKAVRTGAWTDALLSDSTISMFDHDVVLARTR
jgi:hypothetical protein